MPAPPDTANSPHIANQFSYSYPFGTGHLFIFASVALGAAAFCGGAFTLVTMPRQAAMSGGFQLVHIYGILISLFLMYGGLNFLFLGIWKYPYKLTIDDAGVRVYLIGNRQSLLSWTQIEIFKDSKLNFKFGPAPTGARKLLVYNNYVVLHSMPFMKRFFDFKSSFKKLYQEKSGGR